MGKVQINDHYYNHYYYHHHYYNHYYHQSQVEAVEGSSWLSHRGTGTRVALNVTANSQWKEVNNDDEDNSDDNDGDDDCNGGEKYNTVDCDNTKGEG